MPAVNSSLTKPEDGTQFIGEASLGQLAGVVKTLSRATFDSLVAAERTRIQNNGIGVYKNGERIGDIHGEVGSRYWTLATGGSDVANAAASHGRLVQLPSGQLVPLIADANTIKRTTGAPVSGGTTSGDKVLDHAAGKIYTWTTAWDAGVAVDGVSSGAASQLTGTAAPEGAVTAAAGTFYGRTGASAALYYKMSGAGNTGWVEMVTSGSVVTPPGAVSSVAAATTTSVTQGLTWTAAAGATSYQVAYRLGSSNGAYTNSGAPVAGLAATVVALSPATAYDYQVTPINAAGSGTPGVLNDALTSAGVGDTTPPTVQSVRVNDVTKTLVVILFNEELAAFTPDTSAFAVSGGKAVSAIARGVNTITLTVDTAYAQADIVTVTYTKPGSNQLRDLTGNEVATFTRASAAWLLLDEFSDGTAVALTSRSPTTGAAWTGSASLLTTGAGKASTQASSPTDTAVLTNLGVGNYTVSAVLQGYHTDTNNRGLPGLIVKWTDINTNVYVELDTFNGYVSLNTRISNIYFSRVRYAIPKTSGSSVAVKVECYKNNITLWVDGVEQAAYVHPTDLSAQTTVGFVYGKVGTPPGQSTWDYVTATAFEGYKLVWPIFAKVQSTPVMAKGVSPAWNHRDINNPTVTWDAANNRWISTYSGSSTASGNVQHQGLMTAPTLTTASWTDLNPTTPNLTSDTQDGIYAVNGGLRFWRGKWWLMNYSSNAPTGGSLRLFTSTDLTTWTDRGIKVTPTPGGWNSQHVSDASLRVTEDDKLECIFTGARSGGTNDDGNAIGLLYINEDYTVDNRSLTEPWARPPSRIFNGFNAGEPNLYCPPGYEGKRYLMTIDCNINSGGTASPTQVKRYLGQGITLDGGKTWHWRSAASTPEGGGAWESNQNFDGDVVVEGDVMHVFYSGANTNGGTLGMNIQIGRSQAPWVFKNLVEV